MDYSTDEDVSPETPVKHTPTKSISTITESDLTVGDLDIKALTDEELQERLQQVGLPVTPIVGSTRRLFEKKLAQALLEQPSLELQSSDDEAEEEEAAAEVPVIEVNGDIAEESDASSDDEVTTPAAPVAVTPRRSPRVKAVQEPEVRQRTVHTEETSSSSTVTSTSSSSNYLRSSGVSPLSQESKSPYARPPLRSTPSSGNYQSYTSQRYATSSDVLDSAADKPSTQAPPTRYLPAIVKIVILVLLIASAYILFISYSSDSPYAAVEEAARLAVKTLQAAGDGDEDQAD